MLATFSTVSRSGYPYNKIMSMGESCLATTCGSEPPGASLTLFQALDRFTEEAVQGVCRTRSYHCSYFTWGTGPTLVCVPGMAVDSRAFIPLLAFLSRHFRCVAYDLPKGHGDGARLEDYHLGTFVGDLHDLLDHLQVPQCFLLGFSFGSTIALASLHEEPERVTRGVLLGGFAHRSLAPAEVLLARLARHWHAPLEKVPFFAPLLRHSHYGPFAARSPQTWEYFLHLTGSTSVAAFADRVLRLHDLDVRPMLGEVRQPVLLVTGDLDPLVPGRCTEELIQGLPNAHHVELADCGHYPLFTHPEPLAEIIRQFLAPRE